MFNIGHLHDILSPRPDADGKKYHLAGLTEFIFLRKISDIDVYFIVKIEMSQSFLDALTV